MQSEIKHILLSRTDSIGDVVLTLPMAGMIKRFLPSVKVSFLGRTYTEPVIALSEHVDHFINYDDLYRKPLSEQIRLLKEEKIDAVIHVFPKSEISSLMKKAEVRYRVGTTNRMYHWFHCNRLLKLSRKNSPLHEAQLNLRLLEFLNIETGCNLNEIPGYYGFSRIPELEAQFAELIDPTRDNIILHPKSKGSAREWGLENFQKLIELLPKSRYKVFISGSAEEGKLVKPLTEKNPDVTDLTGKMSLQQFIAFIAKADGLIAASTGPLHIASALNKKALGLFAPMRPIHPGRWAPVGIHAGYVVQEKYCEDCRKDSDCHCIRSLEAARVFQEFSRL